MPCSPLSGSVPLSSRPLVSSGRGVFFHLIVSSRPPLAISSASPHLVSSPVSDDSGAKGVSFLCLVFFVSCRVVSSHQMKASKQDVAGFASPSYLIRVRAWAVYLAAIPSPSRSSSRSIMSSCVSPRLVPSRVISSDDGQASKEAGRVIILGPVIRAAGRAVPGFSCRYHLIPSSPASKQAGGENETASWRRRGSFLSSSGERRGVVILPSAWRFYSHARRR